MMQPLQLINSGVRSVKYSSGGLHNEKHCSRVFKYTDKLCLLHMVHATLFTMIKLLLLSSSVFVYISKVSRSSTGESYFLLFRIFLYEVLIIGIDCEVYLFLSQL